MPLTYATRAIGPVGAGEGNACARTRGRARGDWDSFMQLAGFIHGIVQH